MPGKLKEATGWRGSCGGRKAWERGRHEREEIVREWKVQKVDGRWKGYMVKQCPLPRNDHHGSI